MKMERQRYILNTSQWFDSWIFQKSTLAIHWKTILHLAIRIKVQKWVNSSSRYDKINTHSSSKYIPTCLDSIYYLQNLGMNKIGILIFLVAICIIIIIISTLVRYCDRKQPRNQYETSVWIIKNILNFSFFFKKIWYVLKFSQIILQHNKKSYL